MRTSATLLSAAALAGIVAASPAPQQLDFNAILTAAAPTVTGPALTIWNQTVTINTASIVSSVSAAVTSAATASITGASAVAAATSTPTTTAVAKRAVEERSFNLFSAVNSFWSSVVNKQTATPSSTSTSASATGSSVKATSTGSSLSSSSAIITTTTTQGTTSTSSTTSSSACATSIEAGTYCGFINPEDPCAPQPDGYGPAVTPDTVDAFMNYAPFQSMAAKAVTPPGYVQTFSDLNASTSASSYLGLYTLSSYSPATCASYCDNTTSCTSFNLYIERDPSQNPTANDSTAATVWGYWCPDPTSITNYKCTLWGSDIDATTATNAGGWREEFNVVIVGSNGYDKTNVTTPATISNYTAPVNCSSGAISGGQYWVGSKFYPGAYDPTVCAAYAGAQSSVNKAAAIAAGKSSYTPCNMFNAYHVYQNGAPQGTYCSLYDTSLSAKWASYKGSWSNGNYFGIRNSWTYSLTTQDTGKC